MLFGFVNIILDPPEHSCCTQWVCMCVCVCVCVCDVCMRTLVMCDDTVLQIFLESVRN